MSLILLVLSIAVGTQATTIVQQKNMFRVPCGEVPRHVSTDPHPPEKSK